MMVVRYCVIVFSPAIFFSMCFSVVQFFQHVFNIFSSKSVLSGCVVYCVFDYF